MIVGNMFVMSLRFVACNDGVRTTVQGRGEGGHEGQMEKQEETLKGRK